MANKCLFVPTIVDAKYRCQIMMDDTDTIERRQTMAILILHMILLLRLADNRNR